ncbi:k23 [Silurus meridionalis]|nr:k23 [Silurus meridionalis]
MRVEWLRLKEAALLVHLYKDHEDIYGKQAQPYRGRTSLFKEELQKGNASLKLSDLRVSDEGEYKCLIEDKTWYDDFTLYVTVEAQGSQPVIMMENYDNSGGIHLVCESRGWNPEPEILWMNREGDTLPAEDTQIHRDTEGFNVKHSITVYDYSDSNRFYCRLLQKHHMMETEIIINSPSLLYIPLCLSPFGLIAMGFLIVRWKKEIQACLFPDIPDPKATLAQIHRQKEHGCPRGQGVGQGVGPVDARSNKDIKRTLYDTTRFLQDSRQGTKTPQHPSQEPEFYLEYSRLPGELPLVFKHHISIQMVSHTQWCVVSEMNSFTYGGLTCSANHSFCLEVTEDFSMGQVNILGRLPLDTETSPWWDDTFYEQGTQAVVDAMDLTQRLILQTEYHLNQAQVETNLARKTAQLLSSSSTRSAQYTYTWWDWMFRGCAIGSALIFTFTMLQCCYFRHLIRSTQESTHAALALSPLQIPVFQRL